MRIENGSPQTDMWFHVVTVFRCQKHDLAWRQITLWQPWWCLFVHCPTNNLPILAQCKYLYYFLILIIPWICSTCGNTYYYLSCNICFLVQSFCPSLTIASNFIYVKTYFAVKVIQIPKENTAETDGDAISFAGIWSWTKALDNLSSWLDNPTTLWFQISDSCGYTLQKPETS